MRLVPACSGDRTTAAATARLRQQPEADTVEDRVTGPVHLTLFKRNVVKRNVVKH